MASSQSSQDGSLCDALAVMLQRVKELESKNQRLEAQNKKLRGKLKACEQTMREMVDSLVCADGEDEEVEASSFSSGDARDQRGSVNAWTFVDCEEEDIQDPPEATDHGTVSIRTPENEMLVPTEHTVRNSEGELCAVAPTCESFDDLELHENLLRGVYSCGFEKPTPIQKRAIEPILRGQDTIIQSFRIGGDSCGKTTALLIAILQKIDYNQRATQCLFLSYSREMASEIQKQALALGDYVKLRSHCCIGGTVLREDMARLHEGQQLIIGTSGRVMDMMKKKRIVLSPEHFKICAFDDLDEMVSGADMAKTLYQICEYLPTKNRHLVATMETMTSDAHAFISKFMRCPVEIISSSGGDLPNLEGVRQFCIPVVGNENQKLDALLDLYDTFLTTQTVIFCNSVHMAESLTENMRLRNFAVSTVHSSMDKKNRDYVLREFCSGRAHIIICTNSFAKSLLRTTQNVGLVVNYELPVHLEDYSRRIRCCGKSPDRKFSVISLMTNNNVDVRRLQDIASHYCTRIDEMPANPSTIVNLL